MDWQYFRGRLSASQWKARKAGLRVFLFGSYAGSCYSDLVYLRNCLRKKGFQNAMLVTDLQLARHPAETQKQYNRRCSEEAIRTGDLMK